MRYSVAGGIAVHPNERSVCVCQREKIQGSLKIPVTLKSPIHSIPNILKASLVLIHITKCRVYSFLVAHIVPQAIGCTNHYH